MLARLDDVARWAQSSSVWPLTMGLACCAIEMMSVTAPEYDIARLGSEVFRSSPRQADLMIVSGRVAQKMGPVVKRLYDQMADPKWVISMGACASSGGIFDNYAVIQGVDTIIPVDVYVPGLSTDSGRAALRGQPHSAADPRGWSRRNPGASLTRNFEGASCLVRKLPRSPVRRSILRACARRSTTRRSSASRRRSCARASKPSRPTAMRCWSISARSTISNEPRASTSSITCSNCPRGARA